MRHPPILWSLFFARSLLGVVLLVSGVAKISFPDDAAKLIGHLLSLPIDASVVFVYALSIAECVAALLLVAGRLITPVSFGVGVFLVGAIAYGAATIAHPQPCGCFGALFDSRTDEVFLARNMIMLLLTLYILNRSAATDKKVAP